VQAPRGDRAYSEELFAHAARPRHDRPSHSSPASDRRVEELCESQSSVLATAMNADDSMSTTEQCSRSDG